MAAHLAGDPGEQPGLQPALHERGRSSQRLVALDTLRGAFLILILVTHGFGLLAAASMSRTGREAWEILFGAATPSFVLISGTLFGFFLVSRRDLGGVFRGYRRRAFLFFGLGHLLLALVLYPVHGLGAGSFWSFYVSRWYITDTLGVAFLLMPAVLPSLRPRHRAAIGVALLIASRVDVVLPWARSPQAMVIHQVFFGRLVASPRSAFDCYPLVPILADFLMGSFVGDRLARALPDGIDRFIRQVGRLLPPLAFLSMIMCGGWVLLSTHFHGRHPVLQAMLFPDRTFSLFPVYLALYLGALALLLHYVDPRRPRTSLTGGLALLGRRSLFVFVVQYLVVQTLPSVLGHRYMSMRGLLLFLPFAIAATFAATLVWDRLRRTPAATAAARVDVAATR